MPRAASKPAAKAARPAKDAKKRSQAVQRRATAKGPAPASSTTATGEGALTLTRRKPGRKTGSALDTLARPLQAPDFKLLHAVIQGLDVKAAHERYVASLGASADRRHLAHELRALAERVESAAAARGVATLAQQALGGVKGLRPQDPPTQPNTRGATRPEATDRRRQVDALGRLSAKLLEPPAPGDGLAAWLAADLPARFLQAQMDGKTMPLLTLANLVDYVNLQGHRWWRTVPRLGAERAERIMAWLVPVAAAMGKPIRERSQQKPALQRIGRANRQALALRGEQRSFGLVELSNLSVPEALSGREGVFRSNDVNTMGANTDVEAIHVWLARYKERPRTQQLYTQVIERFYLWCLLARHKPLSSIDEQDMMAYKDFLLDPPADWIQRRQTPRGSPDWRPLRGPLSASTTKLNMSVIASLFAELLKAGYLRAQAAGAVKHSMKLPHLAINIRRSFSDTQWSRVMDYWNAQYAAVGPALQLATQNVALPTATNEDQNAYRAALLRRTRLLLELGASTGLRLREMVTTRRAALEPMMVDGEEVLLLNIIGKGNKPRKVVLFDDVRALLQQHHDDMAARDTAFEPETSHVRSLHGAGDHLAAAKPSVAHLPLIGALRRPPKQWQRDSRGVATLAEGRLADRFGALDPSALYQVLKRFLKACARDAEERGEQDVADGLRRASTHWLRHFFANTAVADEVDIGAIRDALGHASLTTTSIYLHTETKRMVREMAKMRRKA